MSQNNPVISIPKVQGLDIPSRPEKPTEIPDEQLSNNGFFPDVSLLELRNAMRIDGTVTNERLKHATIEAMHTVNKDLKPLRQVNGQPIFELTDLNDDMLNGEYVIEYQYKRAVYCLAVANLYERYRSFETTKEGHDKSDELLETAGDLRRDYHHIVRDMLGENRIIAELI